MTLQTPATTIANPSACDDRDERAITKALAATGHPQLQNVTVCAHEGLVTLKGRVNTYYQKQLAQSVTMQLECVGELHNEIVVV